jgi:hypothetical protein
MNQCANFFSKLGALSDADLLTYASPPEDVHDLLRNTEAASVLGCSVGRIPFLYLGLPIGGDPRRLSFWDPVVNKIRTRLSGWNSRFLSFGGRLVLLKYVLTSLPVYALSFFRAPLNLC